jgi:hypothetical protein
MARIQTLLKFGGFPFHPDVPLHRSADCAFYVLMCRGLIH